ncbi:MAG: hypothetical protein AN484_20320 [Aphanizomenon flos-aquae WA102]|jgi:hypothetical protein|uniref:Glycosyl transferase n=1 Tax=Aphanizomenon flos-aquae WA102 TaxID=1710896 RepID=A0A1B7WX68_APHFL|nr:MAG: hypothetical protein AN484_20320 [Aphanizomenon flos-aquae WA102]
MKIDKIISLANNNVKLRFLAMERSLRDTGCDLPLLVIPYNDNLFDLPKGSTWWEIPEMIQWLNREKSHPMMRKYQCLTIKNYQFVDSDVCFLRNPQNVLEPFSGFITSCGHWHNPGETYTQQSLDLMLMKTTAWQSKVFNAGQFACDQELYDTQSLITTAMQPEFFNTCVKFPHHDQPGLNMLVFSSGVKITNLTLPPVYMESTWAGDYPDKYEHYWTDSDRKPYLIHWAGTRMDIPRPMNQIFYNYLTASEKAEWDEQVKTASLKRNKQNRSFRAFARKIKRAVLTLNQP